MATYITYAVFAVLLGVAFWFALAWHDVKVQRDVAWARLANLKADAETADWYAKRALEAEARVKELEAQLAATNPVSVPSCWVNTTFCQGGALTVGGTGVVDTMIIDTLVQAVAPTVVAQAVQRV